MEPLSQKTIESIKEHTEFIQGAITEINKATSPQKVKILLEIIKLHATLIEHDLWAQKLKSLQL